MISSEVSSGFPSDIPLEESPEISPGTLLSKTVVNNFCFRKSRIEMFLRNIIQYNMWDLLKFVYGNPSEPSPFLYK